MFYRKIVTTFFVVMFVSLILACLNILGGTPKYSLGNYLIGWSLFYMVYVGPIVLIYGNLVSVFLEYWQRSWTRPRDLLYILLHGVLGLANGLLFASLAAALYGAVAALFYAVIDRWLFSRKRKGKRNRLYLMLIPFIVYGVLWGILQWASSSPPPFTAADAVEYATSGKGTAIEQFPDTVGKWEDSISGYHVVRETSVEKIDDEEYIVKFKETWEKGGETGSRLYTYEVDRQSITAREIKEEKPPY
ncbi:hypothetical protein [Virgibacillus siamensis]|uniref:hypothetical protein n=1 Tax=Virgibacillus siamensis TaxID=480071 RepID=UPI001115A44A|nr:hypothetical protein [Virgibacillus siamensis]